MRAKLFKIFLFIFALIFFFQALSLVNLIPIDKVLVFLGQSRDLSELFSSIFKDVVIIFLAGILIETLYSLGLKKEKLLTIKKRFIARFMIAFVAFWLTFFTYGIATVFNLVPGILQSEIVLNFYLFWFLIINILIDISVNKTIQNESFDLSIDRNRITWLSHITGLNKADEFIGNKGNIIYKQSKLNNLGHFIIFFITLLFFSPIVYLIINLLSGNIEINPPEYADHIKIVISFIFLMIVLGKLYLLGMVLSRGIVIYEKAIQLPLATVSDAPLFTCLLPHSCVLLAIDDIVYYKFKRESNSNSNIKHLSSINSA